MAFKAGEENIIKSGFSGRVTLNQELLR